MNVIEPIRYAPDFIKKAAKEHGLNPKAYAIFVLYGVDELEFPALRDRTAELIPAVAGMGEKSPMDVVILDYTGSELASQFGFKAIGIQFARNYRIIFA